MTEHIWRIKKEDNEHPSNLTWVWRCQNCKLAVLTGSHTKSSLLGCINLMPTLEGPRSTWKRIPTCCEEQLVTKVIEA